MGRVGMCVGVFYVDMVVGNVCVHILFGNCGVDIFVGNFGVGFLCGNSGVDIFAGNFAVRLAKVHFLQIQHTTVQVCSGTRWVR